MKTRSNAGKKKMSQPSGAAKSEEQRRKKRCESAQKKHAATRIFSMPQKKNDPDKENNTNKKLY
jgi:hypothetical protein